MPDLNTFLKVEQIIEKIFEAQFLNKLVTLDLSKETLCKYQQKNPRAENLDRYM